MWPLWTFTENKRCMPFRGGWRENKLKFFIGHPDRSSGEIGSRSDAIRAEGMPKLLFPKPVAKLFFIRWISDR